MRIPDPLHKGTCLTLIAAAMAISSSSAGTVSSNPSNFNGTQIKAGDYIWFSSVFKVTGASAIPFTISVRNATIQFNTVGGPYVLPVPDADVTFDPSTVTTTTTFNSGADLWETSTRPGLSGNYFLSGLSYQVPIDFPGGINPVTWSGEFSSSFPVCVNWLWAAAVYTQFASDYDALGVKPCDDTQASVYQNADHAGTPEAFKSFVIGGARGGGGSNYTGSLSATESVCNLPVPAHASTWGELKATYR